MWLWLGLIHQLLQASGGIGGYGSRPDTLHVPYGDKRDPAILAPGSAQIRVKMSRRLAPAHNLCMERQTINGKLPFKRPRSGHWLDPETEDSDSQVFPQINP